MSSGYFENSCLRLPARCSNTNTLYPDACDCLKFYRCDNGAYRSFDCPPGTFLDHAQGSTCVAQTRPNYEAYGCDSDEPWNRCETVSGHIPLDVLARVCDPSGPGVGGGTTTPGSNNNNNNNNNSNSQGGGGGGGGGNVGGIVGGVIGGLAGVLIVVIVIFVVMKKRKGRSPRPRAGNYDIRHNGTQHNTKENEEEVYDVIDEKAVSSEPSRFSIPPYTQVKKETIGHVNTGFQQGDEGDGCYSLAKPLDQLSVPKDNRDNVSRSVSIGGTEIAVEDSEGYQIAYPSGSMPRLPPDEQSDPQPPDYFTLESNPYDD